VPRAIEDYVFGLQVPVDDVVAVQVLYCEHDLGEVGPRPVLLQVNLLVEQFPQVSSRQVLEDEDVAGFLAEGERGLDQMLPTYLLEDLMLSLNRL
jgi:hypothetical protein